MPIWRSKLGAGPTRRHLLEMGLALPLSLAGGAAFASSPAPWPRRIQGAGMELELAAPPRRIVSTSPSLTGTLLAIEAPLVASAAAMRGAMTDAQGFFRQWAPVADARGVALLYPELSFDIEAVILQNPDLVVVSRSGGDSVLPHVPELEAMGFPVLVLDYGRSSWEELAATLGRATGQDQQAARISRDFVQKARQQGASIRPPAGGISIVSYNFFGTYGVSKPDSAQARVLREMGLEVVGLPEVLRGRVEASREFDFVSHENLPAAITGQTIFLLAAGPEDVAALRADPVLANLPAVRTGQVHALGPSSFRVDYYSGQEIIQTVAAELA